VTEVASEKECPHENKEFDPGNHVPPYGWETYPGVYCLDCGEMLSDDEGVDEIDPDLARKAQKEMEQ
jgi:hypothetical protein